METPQPAAISPGGEATRIAASAVAGRVPVDSIDDLVGRLIAEGDMQMTAEGEFGALIEALRRATTMEDVQDILDAFVRAAPGPLRDLLSRSTLAARLAGEVGATIRD